MNKLLSKRMMCSDRRLIDCEVVLQPDTHHRLYLARLETGFIAMAVEVNGYVGLVGLDPWSCPECEVDQLFKVTACFDGVRHLEVNREIDNRADDAGYIYYPNMQHLIDMLTKVRELEIELCKPL